jgi:hypothetical protein
VTVTVVLTSLAACACSGIHDSSFKVTCKLLDLLRLHYESAIILCCFPRLDVDCWRTVDVAQYLVEAYGRMSMWAEADILTAQLRDIYRDSTDEAAKAKIAKWRTVIEAKY